MHADIFAIYHAKVLEYLIAVSYLLLFVPFWRYVSEGRPAPAPEAATRRQPRLAGWFSVPEALRFHPGHAWLRAEGDGLVTVGLDDFASKLIGPVSALRLPRVGEHVTQGERGWTLGAGDASVDMLSPVDGTVVAVNEQAAAGPEKLQADPYGKGWLLKVQTDRLDRSLRQLLSGELARKWMEGVAEGLRQQLSPRLGLVLQDGGQPVDGIARELDPEHWSRLARRFLLSERD